MNDFMRRILVLVIAIIAIANFNLIQKSENVSAYSERSRTVENCTTIRNVFKKKIGQVCNKTRWDYNDITVTSSRVYSTGWRTGGTFQNKGTESYKVNNRRDVQTSAEGKICIGGSSWWNRLDCFQDENGVRAFYNGSYYFN